MRAMPTCVKTKKPFNASFRDKTVVRPQIKEEFSLARDPIILKILFVNHLKPTTASFLRQMGLGKELSRMGHRVSYMGRKPAQNIRRSGKFTNISLSSEPSDTIDITYWREPFEESIPFNLAKLVKKSREFDVIHVNKAYPFTSSLLFVPRYFGGKAIVMDWEDWDGIGGYIEIGKKNLPARFALGFFEEVVPKSCSSIITVSKILAERAERMRISRDRIFYIPNGFDESIFDSRKSGYEIRASLGVPEERPVILLVSALHSYERENFTRILDCLRFVVDRLPNAMLWIAGSGEIEEVIQYAKHLRLEGNVIYLGYVPHETIPKIIAASDVAIHILEDNVYFRSSSPMVVPEYMAMGKAVVASDVGELRTMLGEGAGILVGHNSSSKEFGEAIVSILTDQSFKKKIENSALARAKETYCYRNLARRAELAYKRALEST